MTKLCIVDIDGVIANGTARFAKAEAAKQAFLQDTDARFNALFTSGSGQNATDVFWKTAFAAENIPLDTPVPGAIEALAQLAFTGWYQILLTSRPEHLRAATREWLFAQGYPAEMQLMMKPTGFQYVKTTVWKVGVIQMLAAFYGVTELIVVDDEQINLDALSDHLSTFDCIVKMYTSMALQEPDFGDDHPF